MKSFFKLLIVLILALVSSNSFSQKIVETYQPAKQDSLRIGTGAADFLPYIQKGYTLMIPEQKDVEGVLIFLEDSGYDNRNRSAKSMYEQANDKGFAVLSVSTEVPLDFYFTESSLNTAHEQIKEAFSKYDLPNTNIFFLGASLTGHRALQYLKHQSQSNADFKLNVTGIVIVNFTLDWTRKWNQHKRDIRLNRINLWEPTFMNYMMETYLGGSPETAPEAYHDFSPYSYFDPKNRNIGIYKDYAVRAYIEPAIKYRLKKYLRTLYENNATDMVGFLAELELAGNENTELVEINSVDETAQHKTTQTTWELIDKAELMDWILEQVKN